MARTSARIEFIDLQNNISCIGCMGRFICPAINYIKVDRTFPQILEYYKTVDEWTEICKKFDRAFIPMKTASNSLIWMEMPPLDRCVILVVVMVVLSMISAIFMFWVSAVFMLIALIGLATIAVSIVLVLCRIVCKLIAWQKVKNSLKKSCGRESEVNEVVSFYLRKENLLFRRKYYIECIIGITNGNASDVVESGMNLASSIPVATVVNNGSVYNGAVVTIAPVASAPDIIVPVASAQVDVGVDGSAEDWNDQN